MRFTVSPAGTEVLYGGEVYRIYTKVGPAERFAEFANKVMSGEVEVDPSYDPEPTGPAMPASYWAGYWEE